MAEREQDRPAPPVRLGSRTSEATLVDGRHVPEDHSGVAGRPSRAYLPQLDGLRAVAITLVLVHHALTPIRFGGLVGVDVFFVLSGFLITGLLLSERDRNGTVDLWRFYIRRGLRLYPPLLLTVAVLFVPGLLLARHPAYFVLDTLAALTYTTPLALVVNQGVSLVFRHTWSLGVEELFYLIWPVALLLLLRARRWRRSVAAAGVVVGLGLLAVGVIGSLDGSEMAYLTRSGGLFLGCALSAALHRRPVTLPAALGWAGVVLLGTAVTLATLSAAEGPAVLLANAGALALTAYLARPREGVLVRSLAAAPLAYTGRISYEIYLWHYPVFVLASRLTGLTFFSTAWFCVPVSLALAALSHALLTPVSDRWKARAGSALADRRAMARGPAR